MSDIPPATGRRWLVRVLDGIERLGNALPHPATLFVLLSALVVLGSDLLHRAGVSVQHPVTGATIGAVSLLNAEGLARLMKDLVVNFTGFAPLGSVLVALLGIAACEALGLMGASLRAGVLAAPRRWVPAVVVFAGVMSNLGGDIGYVLVIPLAGAVFHAVGRHPVAGVAAAFAGVSGGFSANLLPSTLDPLLAGLSTEAARMIAPGYEVSVLSNYYFLIVSTFVVTAVGTWVTVRVVEPRLGPYRGEATPEPLVPLSVDERRGLRWTVVVALVLAGLTTWGLLPGGILRDPAKPALLDAPFFRDLVAWIFVYGLSLGLAYAAGARVLRSDAQVVAGMNKTMETMASYLVLMFFAAQFVALFRWTNLGIVAAVEGASLLKEAGLGAVPLMLAFIALTATVNLLIGSASAKWTLLAPVFVPMFMLLGFSPELTQAAFRVGDSVTNIITPLMAYFPVVLVFVNRFDPKAGLGTIIATMLPYSVGFAIAWSVLLVAWILLGMPLGPGAALTYSPGMTP